jgi:hypothetical protein
VVATPFYSFGGEGSKKRWRLLEELSEGPKSVFLEGSKALNG